MGIYVRKTEDGKKLSFSTQYKNGFNPPSMIFISNNEKPLKESDNITVMISSGRKVASYLKDNYFSMKNDKESLFHYTMYPFLDGAIAKFKEYPEFFKFIELSGASKIRNYLTTKLKIPVAVYDENFINDDEKETALKIGNTEIFFPDGTREKTKKECLEFLKKTFEILKSHNYGFLLNGEIRFMPLGTRIVGRYFTDTKDIKISTTIKDSFVTEFTIIHEFAHKYWFEYMSDKDKNLVIAKYNELKLANEHVKSTSSINDKTNKIINDRTPDFNVGDQVEYHGTMRKLKNKIFNVTFRYNNHIMMTSEDNTITLKGSLKDFPEFSKEGENYDNTKIYTYHDSEEWFPTKYAITNYEEWFAESFAYWIFNKQHNTQVLDFWNSILKR